MDVVVGLLLGAGLFCLWWAWWPREPEAPRGGAAGRLAARWSASTRDRLVLAGAAGVTPAGLVAAMASAGLLVLVLVTALTRVPTLGVAFGLLAAVAPSAVVRARASSRRAVLRDLWPEAVDHLASAVRAGMGLPEAVAQLGVRGPEPLRAPFAQFGRDYQATGRFAECLDRLKDRLADPVGDRVVESLRLAREVGGVDLGLLLRTLSGFLRDDARVRGELEARQSWTVNAARLASAAPWAVLALLATRPEAVAAYGSGAGALVLAAGAASTVVAYALMRRVGRLPDDPRVLR